MAANPECRRISLMWGAQTGKSQVQLMAMGFFIDHDPQSIMHMQPSQGDLQTWLTAKFDPMVDSTVTLKSKIAAPRSREGVNNQRMKQYPGGFLMFAWSGSPKTMRGRSAPKIFPDETDGYERTGEGHPVGLIWQRAATFGDQRLLFETSTPTIKGASHIEKAFDEGDQRRWHVDCPHCGVSQFLKWAQVSWSKSEAGEHLPETAGYACESCGSIWDDAERFAAIVAGKWVATKPFRGHASYHLPELASKFRKLRDIVQSFLDKKADGDLQTFVNVSLAETWEEEGDKVEHSALYLRREFYPTKVPSGVCVLFAGVDVQDDRLEVSVYGAGGDGSEFWLITHDIFRGDPGKKELWKRLDGFLLTPFKHESGLNLRIAAAAVDTGGHYTQEVYRFCKVRERRNVFAVKGKSQSGAPIVSRPSKSNALGVNLYSVGTDTAKDLIYSRLKNGEPGPGFVHFPMGEPAIDEEFFEQLTAEKRITKYKNGFPTRLYIKTRSRNEAIDCFVYALAALEILKPNYRALVAMLVKKKEKEPKPTSTDDLTPKKIVKKRKAARTKRKKKSYVKGY